ncbi:hypothetical protein [Actinomadura kijaniata]|nr:hypothetical protein [Actinomadura kijaniata]
MLIAVLFNHERQVVYLPGSAVNCALACYWGRTSAMRVMLDVDDP